MIGDHQIAAEVRFEITMAHMISRMKQAGWRIRDREELEIAKKHARDAAEKAIERAGDSIDDLLDDLIEDAIQESGLTREECGAR